MALVSISVGAFLMFFLGSPIVLIMALWVAATSYFVVDFPLTNMALTSVDGLRSYAFLAVPLFVATGDFLTEGGISRHLTRFARSTVSFMPGATAAASAMASGMFAAVSGSNAATAATMGRILGPELRRVGVTPGMAGSIIATSGTLGIVIPPSTMFVIYGVTLNVSPVDLNLAGMIPGIILMICILVWVSYLTRREEPSPGLGAFSLREVAIAGSHAYLGVVAVAIIFFGMFFGFFSTTEAAGIAALYCLLAGLLVTRQIRLSNLPAILRTSAGIMGIIGPLVVFSIQLQQILGVMGSVDPIRDWLLAFAVSHGNMVVLAIMMLLILVAGAVVESVAVVLILGPIFAPVAAGMGMDPVHWGVVFVLGTSIGFITPPYGLNLFVVSSVMSIPYAELVKSIWKFLLPVMVAWIIVALIPNLSLLLRK